jgi:hypothetical protein
MSSREELVERVAEIEAVRDAGGLWSPHALAQAQEKLRQHDEGLPVVGFELKPARDRVLRASA